MRTSGTYVVLKCNKCLSIWNLDDFTGNYKNILAHTFTLSFSSYRSAHCQSVAMTKSLSFVEPTKDVKAALFKFTVKSTSSTLTVSPVIRPTVPPFNCQFTHPTLLSQRLSSTRTVRQSSPVKVVRPVMLK